MSEVQRTLPRPEHWHERLAEAIRTRFNPVGKGCPCDQCVAEYNGKILALIRENDPNVWVKGADALPPCDDQHDDWRRIEVMRYDGHVQTDVAAVVRADMKYQHKLLAEAKVAERSKTPPFWPEYWREITRVGVTADAAAMQDT